MKVYISQSVIFELPPGVYEVIDINNKSTDLVKVNIATDGLTVKTRLITNNFSGFGRKSFFNILLGFPASWD